MTRCGNYPSASAWGRNRSPADRLALLLDLGFLATQIAQVVQLRPADVTMGHDLDLADDRGVNREGALNADTEADLAHGEGLANSTALATDDDALENLDPLAGAFNDPHVDLERVTCPKVRDIVAQRRGVEIVKGVHGEKSSRQSGLSWRPAAGPRTDS